MRVLIVGCGYVGVPLGVELARHGHQVFGVRRSLQGEDQLRQAGIPLLVADITRPDSLVALPGDWDLVAVTVSASGGGVTEYRQTYFEGTKNLIGWLKTSGKSLKKIVYTSSTGVYGQRDGMTVSEDNATEPDTETGKILVETEKVLLSAARTWQCPVVILRLAGIYGPGRGYWFKQFVTRQARLEGKGERILNMVHRDDVVGALITALERGQTGEVYNVVDDEPVSQCQFFQWLSETMHREMPPGEPAMINGHSKRGLTHKKVSNRKLKDQLGYLFKYPTFREGYAGEIAALKSAEAGAP